MKILRFYLLGVCICALLAFLTEHFYYGKGDASTITSKDIKEDVIYALLSWLGILGVIFFYISEMITKFNNYGYGKELKDFESYLQEEKKKEEEK